MSDTQSSSQFSPPPIRTRFHYIYSCEVNLNVYIKLCSLEGQHKVTNYKDLLEDPVRALGTLDDDDEGEEDSSHMYATAQV